MRAWRLVPLLLAGWLILPDGAAVAHRIDEYLQATVVSLLPERMKVSMRLLPGMLLAPQVIAAIDADGDDVLSEAEQRAYARRKLDGLSITLDGHPLAPVLTSWDFPAPDAMREGLGEIRIEYQVEYGAALSDTPADRTLVLANLHPDAATVFLANAAVPEDDAIRIVSQQRNNTQSVYTLTFRQGAPATATGQDRTWADVASASLFGLGMRHIAEGTDHLLFLLALLLSAPLVAVGGRWRRPAGVVRSLRRVVGIVSTFTVGHSVTLALVATGAGHVPEAPVEVLVALSILVSAAHAVRPLFARAEAWVAGCFGLVHGMAFAATLDRLALDPWSRAVGVLTFNLGIEAMQLAVVGCVLPSLLLLSRTPVYGPVRLALALLAGGAAAGWTLERLLGLQTPVDAALDALAAQAPWLALTATLASLTCSLLYRRSPLPGGQAG